MYAMQIWYSMCCLKRGNERQVGFFLDSESKQNQLSCLALEPWHGIYKCQKALFLITTVSQALLHEVKAEVSAICSVLLVKWDSTYSVFYIPHTSPLFYNFHLQCISGGEIIYKNLIVAFHMNEWICHRQIRPHRTKSCKLPLSIFWSASS